MFNIITYLVTSYMLMYVSFWGVWFKNHFAGPLGMFAMKDASSNEMHLVRVGPFKPTLKTAQMTNVLDLSSKLDLAYTLYWEYTCYYDLFQLDQLQSLLRVLRLIVRPSRCPAYFTARQMSTEITLGLYLVQIWALPSFSVPRRRCLTPILPR